ncbi:MAG: chemotaxis protein CheX [Bdellovibrionota bacterium]
MTAPENEKLIPLALLEAVLETFRTQAQTTAKLAGPLDADAPRASCLSVISLNGPSHSGTLLVAFPAQTFLGLLNRMTGEIHAEVTPENSDASGEFLNIIYASARTRINQAGFKFAPAIPTTIFGGDIALSRWLSDHAVRWNFQTDCGPFLMALSLKKIPLVA